MPLELKSGLVLRNKFAMAPLTNTQSNSDGTLHQREYDWLTYRSGYFGLIETCAAYIAESGKAWDGQLGISSLKHEKGLKQLASGIKKGGSAGIIQLHHAGSKATLSNDKISSSPSEGVRAMDMDDIESIRQKFVDAAIRAERVGFHGIEIHGANGYLFTQFLSGTMNQRNDEYGGSIKNRARFLRETIQMIKESVSSEFSVNVRISPVDTWVPIGLKLEDSKQLVSWLSEDGVDIIHLSLRNAFGPAPFEEDNRSVSSILREHIPKEVRLSSAGGIYTKEDLLQCIEAEIDIVSIGKASIIHHNWPSLIREPEFHTRSIPWKKSDLISERVSERFYQYLLKFSGLVVGGVPPRNS